MIKAIHLFKSYDGRNAVNDISFEVEQGSIMVLLGTSGSGKTTTLKMINRLIEPTSGKILIGGLNISLLNPEKLRKSIGYVSQNNGLFPHYTVEQNIGIVPRLLGWKPSKIRERVGISLSQVLLPYNEFHSKFPHELSGGQQQRVALARALIGDPEIVLMDEPFGALDPITRSDIRREFTEIIRRSGKTTVLVTHDVAEAVALGDRIALMNNGEIVQSGTASDLIFKPESQFVSDFFDGQRLPLEMSVTRLSDVWNLLSVGTSTTERIIDSDISIWETVSLITRENLTSVNIKNDSGETRYTDLTQLINSYKDLRTRNG